jgi:diacylglycerol kinase (ATP)
MSTKYKNKHIFQAFTVALYGIWYCIQSQKNIRLLVVISAVSLVLAIFFNIDRVEWALLFLAMFIVIITEMLNTAVEAVVDMVTQEFHPLAKIAKDVAAGSVLLSAVFSVIVGYLIFWDRLVTLCQGGV